MAILISGCSSEKDEIETENEKTYYEETIQKDHEEFKEAQRKQEELEAQREAYAAILPYKGMEEIFIDDTIVGEHGYQRTETEKVAGTYIETNYYYWYAGGDNPLIVICENGVVQKVTKYFLDEYWDENGMPIFDNPRHKEAKVEDEINQESEAEKTISSQYPYDPYDVFEYDNPDDFAEEWAEEFGDGSFEDGYDDAYDYWEDEWERYRKVISEE